MTADLFILGLLIIVTSFFLGYKYYEHYVSHKKHDLANNTTPKPLHH